MEREEPHLSKPDMDNIEFRPRSYRGPSTGHRHDTDNGLVWKLSLGVGIAVLCALLLFNAYERRQDRLDAEAALRVLNAELKKQEAEDVRFLRDHLPPRTFPALAPTHLPRPLRSDERCIDGDRFRRINNGWQQLPRDPC